MMSYGCWNPVCGTRVGPTTDRARSRDIRAYTPQHLAAKILHSKAALEGEGKQVTVLFADVKGSMELAEQLDPEDWHRIMDRLFQVLAEGVHRFEGTVNQSRATASWQSSARRWRTRITRSGRTTRRCISARSSAATCTTSAASAGSASPSAWGSTPGMSW
ncbi:MAG TPA: hypothetical protein VKH82_04375 [Candidatus Binatia bacterium]|nr:hypothetical protein [Candidatus Binatia bacterium]